MTNNHLCIIVYRFSKRHTIVYHTYINYSYVLLYSRNVAYITLFSYSSTVILLLVNNDLYATNGIHSTFAKSVSTISTNYENK